MTDNRIVIYLNWDGFAHYYYQRASAKNLVPTLDRLRTEGVFLANARSGIPSITNPMQSAIASGAYAGKTGNVKVFYNKRDRIVVEQRRENKAETIVDALYRQGLGVASVHHFTFEEQGTYAGDTERPFIFLPMSTYQQRFDQLYRLLAGKPVYSGDQMISITSPIHFVAVYLDDLDTIGHNNGKLAPIAAHEEERIATVLWRLNQLDTALGILLERLAALDSFEQMAFFLVTDHGMTPFSFDDTSLAAYQDLLSCIGSFGYTYEVLRPGEKPKEGTDIVLCSAGLSLLLSFTEPPPTDAIDTLQQVIARKGYVGKVLNSKEIQATGSADFCDLYISPIPPYIFKDFAPQVGATHDSLDESSQHVFSLLWGSGIKKNIQITRPVKIIDFASTIACLLHADAPLQNEGSPILEALELGQGEL